MPIVKCSNCNHIMIKRKNFYECPICHSEQEYENPTIEQIKNDNKGDLLAFIKNENDNKSVLLNLVNKVLNNNPNDSMALLLSAFINREVKPEKFKSEITNYFNNQEEQANFDIIIKFILKNSEYKFISYLETVLANLKLLSTYSEFIEEKKNEIANDAANTSLIKSDVFVCYSSNDLDRTEKIVSSIEEAGIQCWYANRNMPKNHPTDFEYKKNIETVIKNCKVFLVIMSKNCMYSKDTQWELQVAAENNISDRVEYLISSVKHTPLFRDFFDGIQWINAIDDDQTDVLIERIHYLLNKDIINVNNEQVDHSEKSNNEKNETIESDNSDVHEENCTFNDEVNVFDSENHQPNEFDDGNENFDNNESFEKYDDLDYKKLGIQEYYNHNYDVALNYFLQSNNDSEVNYYLGLIYVNPEFKKYDLSIAFDYFMKSDDERMNEILNDIGKQFYSNKQYLNAFKCFKKSSDFGNSKALYNLAFCYKRGIGVKIDQYLCAIYYKKAADMGIVKAMYEYALICLDENDVMYNEHLGIEYLIKAANNNLVDAQYKLGVCYYNGKVVNKNFNESIKWLDVAITNGSKLAMEFKNLHFNNDNDYSNDDCALELDDLSDLGL